MAVEEKEPSRAERILAGTVAFTVCMAVVFAIVAIFIGWRWSLRMFVGVLLIGIPGEILPPQRRQTGPDASCTFAHPDAHPRRVGSYRPRPHRPRPAVVRRRRGNGVGHGDRDPRDPHPGDPGHEEKVLAGPHDYGGGSRQRAVLA